MKPTQQKGLLIAAICFAVACLFQVMGLIEHLGRLPDDRIGIRLCAVAILGFAVALSFSPSGEGGAGWVFGLTDAEACIWER
jgi:hypothetical protein